VKLKSGAELGPAVPERIRIDPQLEQGRQSNLMVHMSGYSFPLDDVVSVL
jgi:hypothetical protein